MIHIKLCKKCIYISHDLITKAVFENINLYTTNILFYFYCLSVFIKFKFFSITNLLFYNFENPINKKIVVYIIIWIYNKIKIKSIHSMLTLGKKLNNKAKSLIKKTINIEKKNIIKWI